MKISEFMKYLDEQKSTHGDIDVVLSKVDCSYYSWNLDNVYGFKIISTHKNHFTIVINPTIIAYYKTYISCLKSKSYSC